MAQGDACHICLNVVATSDDHDAEIHAIWATSNSRSRPIVETRVAATARGGLPAALVYFADATGDTTVLEVRPDAALRLAAQLAQFTEDCYRGLSPRPLTTWRSRS